MSTWNDKGCEVCRRMWEKGQRLLELGVSVERHATLYRCEECGTYWEEMERFADVLSEEEVKRSYPQVTVMEKG